MSICRSDLVLCLTAFCGHRFPEELALQIPLGLLCFLIHLGCTSGKGGGAQERFSQPAGFKHSSFSPKDGPPLEKWYFSPCKKYWLPFKDLLAQIWGKYNFSLLRKPC